MDAAAASPFSFYSPHFIARSVRIRLRWQGDIDLGDCWEEVPSGLSTVGDFADHLVSCVIHPAAGCPAALRRRGLKFALDGFHLRDSSSINVLRDGDLLDVHPKPARRTVTEAARASPQARAGSRPSAADATKEPSRKSPAPRTKQPAAKRTKRGRAAVMAAQPLPSAKRAKKGLKVKASPPPPGTRTGSKGKAATAGRKQQLQPHAGQKSGEAKTPSRSARRKAARRRLKREGAIPKKAGTKQTTLGHAGSGMANAPQQGDTKTDGSQSVLLAHGACALNPNSAGTGGQEEEEILTFGVQTTVREVARLAAAQRSKARDDVSPQVNASRQTPSAPEAAEAPAADSSSSEEDSPSSSSSSSEQEVKSSASSSSNDSSSEASEDEVAGGQKPSPGLQGPGPKTQLDESLTERCKAALSLKAKKEAQRKATVHVAISALKLDADLCGHLPEVSAGSCEHGMIVVYRLLELGQTFCPEVSEWRAGLIEATSPLLVAPWPVGSHPSGGQKHQHDADDELEEADAPPSAYDEEGRLNADQHSFVDLRLLGRTEGEAKASLASGSRVPCQGPGTQGPPWAPLPLPGAASPLAKAAGSPQLPVLAMPPSRLHAKASGESECHQAPPPKLTKAPAKNGSGNRHPEVVSVTGGWAALAEELAAKKKALAATIYQPEEKSNRADGVQTPGAVRPRGGTRRTAIGPLLSMLRNDEDFAGKPE